MKQQEPRGFWRTYAPAIATASLGLALTGIVWEIRIQATHEEKMYENQQSISQLRGQVSDIQKTIMESVQRVDRMDTPLSHRLEKVESDALVWRNAADERIKHVETETTNNSYSVVTDRDLIENLAVRVLNNEAEIKKLQIEQRAKK
jgi:esterase/lipase